MAEEIHALVLGLYMAYVVRERMNEILGKNVPIEEMMDSITVFDVIARDGMTGEKRLQIEALALCQSYDKEELVHMAWIPVITNPADALTRPTLTKKSPIHAIMQ